MNFVHVYVECCDRMQLIDNTVRIYIDSRWVSVCREGYGCTTSDLINQ